MNICCAVPPILIRHLSFKKDYITFNCFNRIIIYDYSAVSHNY